MFVDSSPPVSGSSDFLDCAFLVGATALTFSLISMTGVTTLPCSTGLEGFLGSSLAGGTGLPGSAGTSGVGGVGVSGSLGTSGVGGVGVSGSLGTSGVGGVGVSGSLGTSGVGGVGGSLYLLQSFVDLHYDHLLVEVYLLHIQHYCVHRIDNLVYLCLYLLQ